MGPRFSGRGARVQVQVEPGYVQVSQGSLGLTLRKCGPGRNLAQSGTGTGPNLIILSGCTLRLRHRSPRHSPR